MANHSSILAWRIPWTGESGLVGYSPWGYKESDMTEQMSMQSPKYLSDTWFHLLSSQTTHPPSTTTPYPREQCTVGHLVLFSYIIHSHKKKYIKQFSEAPPTQGKNSSGIHVKQ